MTLPACEEAAFSIEGHYHIAFQIAALGFHIVLISARNDVPLFTGGRGNLSEETGKWRVIARTLSHNIPDCRAGVSYRFNIRSQ